MSTPTKHTGSFISLIHNEQQINTFLNFLPANQPVVLSLWARKKYSKTEESDKAFGKRDLLVLEQVCVYPHELLRYVRRWEGVNTYHHKDLLIDPSTFCVYVSHGYVDTVGMTNWLRIHLATNLEKQTIYSLTSLTQRAMVRNLKRGLVHFEYDFKLFDANWDVTKTYFWIRSQISQCLAPDSYTVIRTKGGFHMLIDSKKDHPVAMWYKALQELPGYDKAVGQHYLPLPGTKQATFNVFAMNTDVVSWESTLERWRITSLDDCKKEFVV